ncbi:MAG: MraY family glycosyltransferase [Eggerthellaceae bacterium]|jgi:UDP-GlcNAc:undecaprenyl-phosphate GlcNAc-1-phosphate transferase
MDWLEYGVLFAVAAVVTIALTPLARKLAIKLDAIDYPSARRVNMLPIPRMGGVAIFGGILAALAVAGFGVYAFGWVDPFIDYNGIEVNYWGVLLGTVLIFLVGAVDDVVDLNPKAKMLGQIVAACVVAGSGLLFSSIHNPFGEGYIEFGWVAYPLTVFYLVAFANVINLIDGLDGLAAGITGISAITILLFAVLTGRFDAALFSVILVGVCAGFLKSNFFPASIFMGDSGALLLGFSLGVISLFAVARSALFVSLLVPILAAGVPILDTFFAIVRRKREHRPIDEADKGHIHHRLMRAGFSQRATVLIMWAWTALLAACGVIITWADNLVRIPIFLIACAVTAYAIVKLRLLGDALSHHFNPRRKPELREPQEPTKQDR